MVNNKVFPIKVSIDKKYQKIIDKYNKKSSLSRLVNILLDECEKDKEKINNERHAGKYAVCE